MGKRTEFEARREGQRLVLRRRQRAVSRLTWLLAAVPVGAGILVGGWRVAGNVAGPTMRNGAMVLGVVLVVGLARLARAGRR